MLTAMPSGSGVRPTPKDHHIPQTSTNEETDGPRESFSLHSGLSALIQAATSQLSCLADIASNVQRVDDEQSSPSYKTHSDDGISSDGGEKLDSVNRTPTIVPEPDPRKQSFPELLMTLAMDPANVDVIAFLPDDKFFAIRCKEFSEDLMTHYFAVSSFEDFLELLNDWGFTRIHSDPTTSISIEVFRHPQFINGDWERCSHIKFGESPTDARLSALPERTRLDYTMSDDSTANTKRRLSPSFISRRESESSVTSQKPKIDSTENHSSSEPAVQRLDSNLDSDCGESLQNASYSHISHSDDLRSIALSITTEKLNIRHDTRDGETSKPEALIDRAVESATCTIVTDAIETLLRDASHTKETYLKHEKELSQSTLPGVVPISKQLFSPVQEDTKQGPPMEVTTSATSQEMSSVESKS